eukprot:353590-Chlamydomonas_euryale.AAC.4
MKHLLTLSIWDMSGAFLWLNVCASTKCVPITRPCLSPCVCMCAAAAATHIACFVGGAANACVCVATTRPDCLFLPAPCSNASSLWLGMRPADIFVYIFLPPFLLDVSVRIDFYVLKRMLVAVIFMAFIMVISACILFIPFMLDALNLKASGWTSADAALFGATIASTDAAAVASCLNSGGAPAMLAVILEGESLFNDASSLTLFDIFHTLVLDNEEKPLGDTIAHIVVMTLWAVFTGVAIGVGMGIFNQLCFMHMQHWNYRPAMEVAFSVGGCYMAFYLTQVWCDGSGCIAAVVYGLYGNATLLWGMSKKARGSLMFKQFWEVLEFIINALIFFYVGAAVVNFVVRSGDQLYEQDGLQKLFQDTMYRLPLIFVFSFVMRGVFAYFGFKLFKWCRIMPGLTWQQIAFITIGGLRGSLSLVLAAAIAGTATDREREFDDQAKVWG